MLSLIDIVGTSFVCSHRNRHATISSLRCITPSSGDSLTLRSFCPVKHEAVRAELREKQEDMDQLISTVEDLQRELEKIPKSDANSMQGEMELLRDQWLEVDASSFFLAFSFIFILQTVNFNPIFWRLALSHSFPIQTERVNWEGKNIKTLSRTLLLATVETRWHTMAISFINLWTKTPPPF